MEYISGVLVIATSPILYIYILSPRPVRLFILKQLGQFNLFYAAQYITTLVVISSNY
jgi:hypothetical protein